MSRELPESSRERPRGPRGDGGDGYASGERSAPRQASRGSMTPPSRGSTPSDPSGRRPSANGGNGGNGLLRRSMASGGPDNGDPRSSGPSSAASRGAPRNGNGNGNGRRRDDGDPSAEQPSRGQRRSMASMARDVSRSMSRQLSSVMSRVGRSMHHEDASGPRRAAPPPPRRSPVPPEIAAEVAARPYRRSRARMIVGKWRRARVRPNPIGYAVIAMVTILLTLVIAVGGGAGMAYAVNYYNAHIGQIQAIANLNSLQNSVIYDRNGQVIYTAKGNDSSYKFYFSLKDINPVLQWATIDMEDHTFYSNPGIDIAATLRALLGDVKAGGANAGGSGITQQLVKIAVLDDASKQLQRKINEAIISVGMTVTQAYDKNTILEMYLNSIDYGDQNTGIEAAARNFFGLKETPDASGKLIAANQQLDLAQIAILVGLPNAPTEYLPIQYSTSCNSKKLPCTIDQWDNPWAGLPCGPHISSYDRDWYSTYGHEWLVLCRAYEVLDSLKTYGGTGIHFSDADYANAKSEVKSILENEKIYHWAGLNNGSTAADASGTNLAPHFVEYVTGILNDQFGIDHLESAGLRIYTTLDLNLQTEIKNSLKYYIQGDSKGYSTEPWYGQNCPGAPLSDPCNGNAHNGAAVAIDQYTGDILAMVGSVDYNNKDKKVAGAVNITTANRSMGSATKPIVYATAFQMGWNPGTMLQDVPICFPGSQTTDPQTHKLVKNPDAVACDGYYAPRNYEESSYHGTVPLRRLFDESLNIPATEAMSFVGMTSDSDANVLSMARRLGITTLSAGRLGPTTALGGQEIPLLQLTGAYATFANLGKRNPPRAVLRIEDISTGAIKWQAPNPNPAQVISPQASYMVTNVLTDNFARYPAFKLRNPLHLNLPSDGQYTNMQLAAKTGTSSGNVGPRDIVTAGYSPYMTLGIWIGNSDASDLSPGIIGIAGAGYVFHDVMLWAAKQYHWDPNAQFEVPGGLAYGTFNCNTGLAAYKGSKTPDLQCPFAGHSAPTCDPKKNPPPGYCANDPYNPDLNSPAPPGIGQFYGIDRDLYVQGQYPGQS